jgi:hypothetical protein
LGLEEPGAKTNRLAVNRQLQSNPAFEFDSILSSDSHGKFVLGEELEDFFHV